MKHALALFLRDPRGATAIEYGLAVALIVVVLIAGVSTLGGSVSGKWGNISASVAAVTPT